MVHKINDDGRLLTKCIKISTLVRTDKMALINRSGFACSYSTLGLSGRTLEWRLRESGKLPLTLIT